MSIYKTVALHFLALVIAIIMAFAWHAAHAQVTCQQYGNQQFCSNGLSSQTYGNQTFYSNGVVRQQYGNQQFYSAPAYTPPPVYQPMQPITPYRR